MGAVAKVALAAALLAALGAAYYGMTDRDAGPATQPAAAGADAPPAQCAQVLSCVAPKFQREASDSCKGPIEQLAVYAPRWKQLPGDTIFDGYEWLVQAQGSIRYVGHRAEFGNAGGVYAQVAYECDFDPATRKVLDVRVKGAGRS